MSAHLSARASRRTLGVILKHAARQALQLRLLLLWLLGMALPTLLFALPVMSFLGSELDHSPAAAPLASSFRFGAVTDLLDAPGFSFGLFHAVLVPALIVMLLISPWLNALALGAARIPGAAKFRALIGAANAAYWPMVRMGLFGLLPTLLALILAKIASSISGRLDARAILESPVDQRFMVTAAFSLLVIAFAQCTVEVGRAVLVAHPRRRSVLRAWWAGLGFLRRHPLRLFGTWLLITLPSQLLVAILMILRTNLDQGGVIGLVAALVLAEAAVLCLAWMRCARLFSLVDLLAHLSATH